MTAIAPLRHRHPGPRRTALRAALAVCIGVVATIGTVGDARAATTVLVPFNTSWRFLDTGVHPGSGWTAVWYDHSAWRSGLTEIGYGDGDESTVARYGPDPAHKFTTTWFRRRFTVPDLTGVTAVTVRVRRDDGVVLYLNGVEVGRNNLPPGVITPTTPALTPNISETQPVVFTLPPSILRVGTNAIAAEVHQARPNSTDISFNLELSVNTTPLPTQTVFAAGDLVQCGGQRSAQVAQLVNATTGTFLPLGDLAYASGSPTEYTTCYDPLYRPALTRTQPVPGNHEHLTANAAGYFGYFGTKAGTYGHDYRSWDVNGWHLIALDSECRTVGGCGPGSPMYAWLERDLAQAATPCIAIAAHKPPFSSVAGKASPDIAPLFALAHRFGVDVWLAGHAHVYERFARIDGTGARSADGTRLFVVGTGGASSYTFGTVAPGSDVRRTSIFGGLRLSLRPGGYSWAFSAIPDTPFQDTGSATCR